MLFITQSLTLPSTLSLRGLPGGMYLIQLQTERGSVSKKLVKEMSVGLLLF
jgi:hypothetical protein